MTRPTPLTAKDKPPQPGQYMIWLGKPRRMADCPVHRVLICEVPERSYYGYKVHSDESGRFHTCNGSTLLWPGSLQDWLQQFNRSVTT
jgi:hypothetical protein